MNLLQFLNFNRACPSCNKPLTLYLRLGTDVLLRGTETLANQFQFTAYWTRTKNHAFTSSPLVLSISGSSDVLLDLQDNPLSLLEDPPSLFFLCREEGIYKEDHYYEIDAYHACYYRATGELSLIESQLPKTIQLESSLINQDEVFSFSCRANQEEKSYVLHLNYQDQKTILHRYHLTEEEENRLLQEAKQEGENPEYHPDNILESKELPIPDPRMDFSLPNRQALLERLEQWVALS
jgi:hypothetical protein